MYRGAGASIPRAFVGSVAQLVSFQYAKEYLHQYDYFDNKPRLKTFVGSMVGGVAISVMMNPFDLILTRLYNQRKLKCSFVMKNVTLNTKQMYPNIFLAPFLIIILKEFRK